MADPNVVDHGDEGDLGDDRAGPQRSRSGGTPPAVRSLPELPGREEDRDLPQARSTPETGHGYKTEQVKEGHI